MGARGERAATAAALGRRGGAAGEKGFNFIPDDTLGAGTAATPAPPPRPPWEAPPGAGAGADDGGGEWKEALYEGTCFTARAVCTRPPARARRERARGARRRGGVRVACGAAAAACDSGYWSFCRRHRQPGDDEHTHALRGRGRRARRARRRRARAAGRRGRGRRARGGRALGRAAAGAGASRGGARVARFGGHRRRQRAPRGRGRRRAEHARGRSTDVLARCLLLHVRPRRVLEHG